MIQPEKDDSLWDAVHIATQRVGVNLGQGRVFGRGRHVLKLSGSDTGQEQGLEIAKALCLKTRYSLTETAKYSIP